MTRASSFKPKKNRLAGEPANGEAAHIPVMSVEVISSLSPAPGEFFIDGTFGAGGHARLICERLAPGGVLLAVDRDPLAYERAAEHFSCPGVRVIAKNANYSSIPRLIEEEGLPKANGLLLDLGFSSLQLEEGRGFSFMKDEPLLMTYSDEDEPLRDILHRMTKDEMADAIYLYSGERFSRHIADAIFKAERKRKIETTGELVSVIKSVLPRGYERGRINPATRTFLAFRILVNRELDHLREILDSLPKILAPGSRVAIITFQSLEDREVKEKFKELSKKGIIDLLSKKPIPASREESAINPRARSAKLRSAVIK